MTLNSLFCADVLLSNYSLSHSGGDTLWTGAAIVAPVLMLGQHAAQNAALKVDWQCSKSWSADSSRVPTSIDSCIIILLRFSDSYGS